jgi:hypothetical protein
MHALLQLLGAVSPPADGGMACLVEARQQSACDCSKQRHAAAAKAGPGDLRSHH